MDSYRIDLLFKYLIINILQYTNMYYIYIKLYHSYL